MYQWRIVSAETNIVSSCKQCTAKKQLWFWGVKLDQIWQGKADYPPFWPRPTSSPGSSCFPIWQQQERRPWHIATYDDCWLVHFIHGHWLGYIFKNKGGDLRWVLHRKRALSFDHGPHWWIVKKWNVGCTLFRFIHSPINSESQRTPTEFGLPVK